MIISDASIPVGKIDHLRMDLPEDLYTKTHLDFEALCRSCQPEDITSKFINAGFRFRAVTPEDIYIIEQIIQEYGIYE